MTEGTSRPRLLVVAGRNGAGKTRIFFIGTETPEINAARIARRVLEGGHEFPIRKIIDRWARSIANAAAVAPEIDRFYLYDNSIDDRDAQLLVRAAEGRVVRSYLDAPPWTAPILKRLTAESPARD
jgi:predicted ABC-type ATPase